MLAALTLAALAAPFVWQFATGDYYMTVTGESMRPTYEVGDVLVVQEPTGNELTTPGAIVVVAFTPGDKSTQYVHRVLEPSADGAILKGDNNDTPDPNPITEDQVMGTPRLVLAGDAAVVYRATQHPLIRFPLAAVALILLVVPLRRRRKETDTTAAVTSPADLTDSVKA
ncbi:signal peptidase I [Microbacterium phyllosphaerae]